MTRNGALIVLIFIAFLTLSACASRHKDREPVYSVSGSVCYKGKPAVGAIVVFNQIGEREDKRRAIKPFARTTNDGTFKLNYYTTGDGAPAGEYVVTLVWPSPPAADETEEGPDRLNGRYSNPTTSKWRITLSQKPLELKPFNID